MIRLSADRAADLVALAVIVSVGLAAVPVVERLAGRADGPATAAVVAAAPPPPVDLAPLRRLAPFGTAAAPGVPGDPAALGLQLRGVLLARPASGSIALIAAAGGPAKGYGVGATLPGGAIVDSVEYDLVVLRVDGQLVTLALPAKPGNGAPGPAGPAATDAAPAAAPAATADPIAAFHAEAHDPLTLLGSLGAAAGPDGYRVGTPPDEARRAGLQSGDVVERVDGVAVGDPARDRRLFDDAVVAGRMRVDVVRAGRPVTLTLPLH